MSSAEYVSIDRFKKKYRQTVDTLKCFHVGMLHDLPCRKDFFANITCFNSVAAIYVPLSVNEVRLKLKSSHTKKEYVWSLKLDSYPEPSLEEMLKESKRLPTILKGIDTDKYSSERRQYDNELLTSASLVINGNLHKRVVLMYPYICWTGNKFISLDEDCTVYVQQMWFVNTPYIGKKVFTSRTSDDETIIVVSDNKNMNDMLVYNVK